MSLYRDLQWQILIIGGHRRENEDLIVHFTVTFNMRRLEVSTENIRQVLARETNYLGNRTIDPSSIKIQVVS